MQNQPLSSNEQAKLFIFSLLLAPAVFLIIGVIPASFLVFGFYMMKKNEDFSNIETAVRNFKWYTWLGLIGSLLSALVWGSKFLGEEKQMYSSSEGLFIISLLLAGISLLYLISVHFLFLNPLKSHSEWVVINGIFSSKPKSVKVARPDLEVDIIKSDKLKQYSVADELIKWAKLKEDGHISENEFIEARNKLLKRT